MLSLFPGCHLFFAPKTRLGLVFSFILWQFVYFAILPPVSAFFKSQSMVTPTLGSHVSRLSTSKQLHCVCLDLTRHVGPIHLRFMGLVTPVLFTDIRYHFLGLTLNQ